MNSVTPPCNILAFVGYMHFQNSYKFDDHDPSMHNFKIADSVEDALAVVTIYIVVIGIVDVVAKK